jgi:hypothetical protein
MEKYINENKDLLKKSYVDLGKIKNICSCKKKHIKNYSDKLKSKWAESWKIIHNFSINLPIELEKCNKDELKKIYDFFNKDVSNIPCIECRKHYSIYIKQHFIEECKTKMELFDWTMVLHNDINNRNNKKNFSKDEIYKLFEIPKIIQKVTIENNNKISFPEKKSVPFKQPIVSIPENKTKKKKERGKKNIFQKLSLKKKKKKSRLTKRIHRFLVSLNSLI